MGWFGSAVKVLMSIKPRISEISSDVRQNGYSIRPISPRRFTDWNGGSAVAHRPENRRDDVLLERPTMEMGNETKIGYDEAKHPTPSESYVFKDRDFYERLRSHNRDTWWEYREDSTISEDADEDFKAYLIKSFASQVGLNPLLKQRAFRHFMKLDLSGGTGRTETNAFVVCSLVGNKEANRYGSDKLYHPQRKAGNNDEAFQRLEEALIDCFARITKSMITKVYNKHCQGDPPTRHSTKWKGKVKSESYIPYNPSFARKEYNPQTDSESQQ